jgi:hypothetical protein
MSPYALPYYRRHLLSKAAKPRYLISPATGYDNFVYSSTLPVCSDMYIGPRLPGVRLVRRQMSAMVEASQAVDRALYSSASPVQDVRVDHGRGRLPGCGAHGGGAGGLPRFEGLAIDPVPGRPTAKAILLPLADISSPRRKAGRLPCAPLFGPGRKAVSCAGDGPGAPAPGRGGAW